jgi:hypothetical protein
MHTLVEENTRVAHRWNHWPRWAAIACAAALLLFLLPLLPTRLPATFPARSLAGEAMLAQSVHAMSNMRTVHITGRIRTLPNDNFELAGAQYNFVPIEIWREYANPPRWRVQKPGRVAVMDGQNATLYIPSANEAVKGAPDAHFFDWLRPLLDPQTILESELAAARRGEAQVTLSGATVSLYRTARGNFANDWARNQSIPESDHTTIYRFDNAGRRLEGLQVLVGGTLIAEFNDFCYDEEFPASTFTISLPPNVEWITRQSAKPQPVFQNAREAAVYFFDGLARQDWDAVLQVSWGTSVNPAIRQTYGGLQVISLGEPFQSGLYPGYFVPYEVRLRDGYVKSHKLALRNDNPEHRWVVDGGY